MSSEKTRTASQIEPTPVKCPNCKRGFFTGKEIATCSGCKSQFVTDKNQWCN